MISFQSENPDKVRIEDVGDTFEGRKVQKLVVRTTLRLVSQTDKQTDRQTERYTLV